MIVKSRRLLVRKKTGVEMSKAFWPGTKLEMNVDRYVDERLLDELEKEGLFKKISEKG